MSAATMAAALPAPAIGEAQPHCVCRSEHHGHKVCRGDAVNKTRRRKTAPRFIASPACDPAR
ncbi:hypothetical protein A8D95_16355 [Burkholderia cenocepacia]|uniref:Uncharacterized protein n=1 Tax=Burkholderia cenocepacia TaxID=95486 RepID=A0A1V2W9Q3_9BURK|nr:hypothetical protein A8E75_26435 [Burkholderia cenocepacia]ONJ13859.1 hypothetical protein A8D83_12955 [Burkholderia cenocepacia]ONJ30035.1 hypothetical protein A8D90_06250 [Burkholderia cenocepacia]ONP18183.1 hypothetical protein A8D84_34930 [Burkholderia cenocepacia]ONP28435.1 hypothetical protein A8D85_35500 [Burkholderia cenocepacia]